MRSVMVPRWRRFELCWNMGRRRTRLTWIPVGIRFFFSFHPTEKIDKTKRKRTNDRTASKRGNDRKRQNSRLTPVSAYLTFFRSIRPSSKPKPTNPDVVYKTSLSSAEAQLGDKALETVMQQPDIQPEPPCLTLRLPRSAHSSFIPLSCASTKIKPPPP
jgi:hypothetical protein